MGPAHYLATPAEPAHPLKMVRSARSPNSRAQRTKTGSKISQKWSIQHAWPVRDAMARVGVMIEADAIRTDMHHQGAGPEAFPGSAHLAQLASVHVPVSSAAIQTPLEFLGATRRQSGRASLPYRHRHRAHRPLPERATPRRRLLVQDFGTVLVSSDQKGNQPCCSPRS